jgi:sugar lactone lactonase YvrE
MATASFHGLRRFLASILIFGLFGAGLAQMAAAQGTPQVTSSYVTALTHPSGWEQIMSSAITSEGDLLVLDSVNAALYEFPANGGAMVTLVAPGGVGASYWSLSLVVDSTNAIYLPGNWGNCINRYAYDPTSKAWPDLAALTGSNPGGNCSNPFIQGANWHPNYYPVPDSQGWIQPSSFAIDANNNLYASTFNWNLGLIFEVPITTNNGVVAPGAATTFLSGLGASTGANPTSMAIDPWGNIYVLMNDQKTVHVLYELPAGTPYQSNGEAGLSPIALNLTNIEGVQTDAAGNLYVSDAQAGVVMVPAAKGPGLQPQTAAAVYLSPVAGLGSVSIDFARNILYVPTKPKSWSGWNGFYDVVAVNLNNAELGSTPVGTPVTSTIYYDFSGSVTPASIAIEEAGVTAADFSVATGGSCQAGTAYTAGQNCTVNVSLNPQVAGNVSAKLVMRDNAGNTLVSTVLHGTGQAPMLAISPAAESTIGSGLQTPSQVAVDAAGNAYVADAGLGAVVEYPVSSGATTPTNIGTGLKNPTGVAVNGAGDVFIADAGNVYEVPNTASGLNSTAQITLKSWLGANLNLAVDGLGDLFIADPANQRVVKLSNPGGTFPTMAQTESDLTGLNAPSLVATDASGNLYVVDGVNLIQITPVGQQTTITNTVSNATGLAVDASGALYIAAPSASMRIPWVNGAWAVGSPVTIAASVSNPKGIALDSGGDLFTADATAENIHVYGASGELNFGTLTLGQTPSLEAALTNQGNEPMDITGFTVSNAVDYSASGTACTASALPQGTNCDLTVTLSPGPGDQGTLSTQIQIQGNQANSATLLSAIGVGASLAKSVTTVSVASSASVVDVPVTVTVSPASGTGTPTGDVTVSVDGANPTTKALSNGTVKFDFMPISAGSHTFSVTYQGDRAFGSSTASTTATVAKGAVTMSEPAPPKYVLSNGESYGDQNTTQYYFPLGRLPSWREPPRPATRLRQRWTPTATPRSRRLA